MKRELTFIIRDTDPQSAAVEDDVREDLAKVGMNVQAVFVNSSEFVDAERNGEYNMLITRTWVSTCRGPSIALTCHPTLQTAYAIWLLDCCEPWLVRHLESKHLSLS